MNTAALAENGILPYWLIRMGIRMRLRRKIQDERAKSDEEKLAFIGSLADSEIAYETDKANEQHYELPPGFFERVLGPRLKYSSAYWPEGCETLEQAEIASLELVAERVQMEDGLDVLDMGCGWGSFSLWAAEKYPNSRFLAVSNSAPQRRFILARAEERGLKNLEVVTCDINVFDPQRQFDRIVSIEMLEHARNYDRLFERVASWMREDARFFAHVFSHTEFTYPYLSDDPSEWMARYFFSGGIMPGHDLLPSFDRSLATAEKWHLSGEHYQKTSEAWLENFDRKESEIRDLFAECYGEENVRLWMWRWRLFFLACAELFGFKKGQEWGVSHYLFKKRPSS